MLNYFQDWCRELGIPGENCWRWDMGSGASEFNMTALAVRGSRFHNGVSRIHGDVSAQMLRDLWPQIPPRKIRSTSITNGVHVPTFLSPEWLDVFDRFLGYGWSQRLRRPAAGSRSAKCPTISSGAGSNT